MALPPNSRVIASIVHDVLDAHHFVNRRDLVAAIATACDRLRLSHDAASIETAIRHVQYGQRRRKDVPAKLPTRSE